MLPNLVKRVCKYCEAPVPNHGVDQHCGELKCKFKYMEEKKKETQQYWQAREEKHREDLEAYAHRFAQEKGVDHSEVGTATVPSCKYSLKPVPSERVEDFVSHVSHCLNTIDSEKDDREFKTPRVTKVPEHLIPVAIQACATCRGDCCKQGNMFHAFILRVTLKRVLEHVEDVDVTNLVEVYKSHIPKHSIEHSCIYHTETGCNLRSDLRADICGDFFCLPASSYIVNLRDAELPKYHAMAAARNCDVDVVRVVDSDGNEHACSDGLLVW